MVAISVYTFLLIVESRALPPPLPHKHTHTHTHTHTILTHHAVSLQ